ncbi:MAG: FkbM family methyltransferase [Chitinophagia bacterium]|jgi:FkbM family methyltransferase
MTIQATKASYSNKEITKVDFINLMHQFHKVLFDFSDNLKDTEINKIEILDGNVVFTTRPTNYHPGGCSFFVDVFDKRVTPIDTFNFDLYEKEDSEMFYSLINDGDTIFDIGANIGWYSCHIAKMFPKSVIYSFEPIPDTFLKLERNVNLNQFSNIRVHNLPFYSHKEIIDFYYSPFVTGASGAINITENDSMHTIACETDTIDNFISVHNIDKIDIIKCDVEGAEFYVFQGGGDALKKYKPIVFSEMLRKWAAKFGYTPNDIIRWMENLEYECFICSEKKLLKIESVSEDTVHTNFFFLNKERHINLINQYTLHV